MKWHIISGARGLRQKQSGTTQEHSDEGLDTPEADTQRSLRDWYVQVQADIRILQKAACDPATCECSKLSSTIFSMGVSALCFISSSSLKG
jgi:hypothetical protein